MVYVVGHGLCLLVFCEALGRLGVYGWFMQVMALEDSQVLWFRPYWLMLVQNLSRFGL